MTYKETIKEIDKIILMYNKGLILIPEALKQIEKIINDFMSCYDITDEIIKKQNRLYCNGLNKLVKASRQILKH